MLASFRFARPFPTLLLAMAFAMLASLPALAEEPAAVEPAAVDVSGAWLGTLDVGAIKLRLVVKIAQGEDGALSGSMDSLDQNVSGIPIDEAALNDRELRLELKSIQGVFVGALNEAGTEIEGIWSQGPNSLPLVLKKTDEVPVLRRPQEPQPPLPYRAEEVAYDSRQAGTRLAGTLTVPEGEGPFPAVLLITGSGAQDRDEGLLGHKPFLVLADYLTRRGIAVLRVDDRGVGGSTGDFGKATSQDFAEDVLGGVDFLKGRGDIKPSNIGLIGHSEGGLIAPLVASRCEDVAFLVLLAGPGVTGEQILYAQGELISKAGGASDELAAQTRASQEAMFAVVREVADNDAALEKLRAAFDNALASLDEIARAAVEAQRGVAEQQMQALVSPWFRFFLAYDPAPTLQLVKCPVLAVNGEKDLQVPPDQNLPVIAAALAAGGNTDFAVRELPGLNHLFQTSETGAPAEYGLIEETFSPAALEIVGDWIEDRVR